jgi:regulator of protease activity HflC (stomatin/prohibitin superfamily)
MDLDISLGARTQINQNLKSTLDEATGKWGIQIIRVEVQEIIPPADLKDTMEKQMVAERERRVKVLAAQAEKEALVLMAEANKQQIIMEAEAKKTQKVLQAEAEKLGNGQATKLFFPQEISGLMGTLFGIAEGVSLTKRES